MNTLCDPSIEQVVFVKSSQVGATEILNNIVGYFIHQDPSTVLLVQPTLDLGGAWSKDRLVPMIRDTRVLSDLVHKPRATETTNTILHKQFVGGHITIAGANSPASLASRPIRILLCDEVDRYPRSAGKEGDPIALARKRTTTYWNKKIFITSTPTFTNLSRVEHEFDRTDKRYYHVRCPHCDEAQRLLWTQIKPTEAGRPISTENYYYECLHCHTAIPQKYKPEMIANGFWKPTKVAENPKIAGFHISEFYSPWSNWRDIVANWTDSRGDPELMKVWTNTVLGESWELKGDKFDETELQGRAESYPVDTQGNRLLPEGIVALTAGIDTHDDRLELEVLGWGRDEESWVIEMVKLHGDPARRAVWAQLEKLLIEPWKHIDGDALKIIAAGIDIGGHRTDEVFNFAGKVWRGESEFKGRLYPMKGATTPGSPVASRLRIQKKRGGVPLALIGTDSAKDAIYGRLKINRSGPNFIHFSDHLDQEFYMQLTAEVAEVRKIRGRAYRSYVPIRERNEALDCFIYAFAALRIFRRHSRRWLALLDDRRRKLRALRRDQHQNLKPNGSAPSRRRRSLAKSWAESW